LVFTEILTNAKKTPKLTLMLYTPTAIKSTTQSLPTFLVSD